MGSPHVRVSAARAGIALAMAPPICHGTLRGAGRSHAFTPAASCVRVPEPSMTSAVVHRRPDARPQSFSPDTDPRAHWLTAFRAVRDETERRAAPLSSEDQVVQSMPDASPVKWHRAHTTWFFEQFLLKQHAPGYRAFDEDFAYLFNSYYVAAGPRYARPKRGLVTRPDAAKVAAYRAHVDAAVAALIADAKP